MAKLSAKKRVRIWGESSPFIDQIHKVIFDRLPYSKYLSELGQNRPTAGKAYTGWSGENIVLGCSQREKMKNGPKRAKMFC